MTDPTDETSSPRPKRRRKILRLALAALLVLSFLLVVLVAALHTEAIQTALFEAISHRVEEASGVRLQAGRVEISWIGGSLVLEDLSVAAGDAEPFLTARRLHAELSWRELLAAPTLVRSVTADGAVLDLRRPLPSGGDETEENDGGIDIPEVVLTDGTVTDDTWSVHWPRVTGSLAAGGFKLDVPAAEAARATIVRTDAENLDVDVSVKASGPFAGPYRLEDLSAMSGGLRLSGLAEIDPAGPLSLDVDLDGDPSSFLSGAASGSEAHLEAGGEFDFRRWVGRLDVTSGAFPTELLEPWIGDAARPDGRPSLLDVDVHFTSDPDATPQIWGESKLRWYQDDGTELAHATLVLLEGHLGENGPLLDTYVAEAEATAFPTELLKPWIGDAARPYGRPSLLDLDFHLESDPDAAPQLSGEGELRWHQEGTNLARASLLLTDGRLGETGPLLDSLVGEVHATAPDLPAEILRPWLDDDLYDSLALAGSVLGVDAHAVLRAEDPAAGDARAKLVWRRGDETIAEANVRSVRGRAPLHLAFDAKLLAAEPGRREVTGRLTAPSWAGIGDGKLQETQVALDLPELADAVAGLRRRWPGLLPELDPEVEAKLVGSVVASADLDGRISDPEANVEATWRQGGSTVAVTGSIRPAAKSGAGAVALERLDLAQLLADAAGEVTGTVGLRGSAETWTADFTLDGDGLRYGEPPTELPSLHLAGTIGDDLVLALREVSGRFEDTTFAGEGSAELAELKDGGKLHRAHLTLTAEKPFESVERAVLVATFDDGVVELERLDLDAVAGRGELRGKLPLAGLAALGMEPDTWGLAVADGPVVVHADIPELDFGALFEELGQEASWTALRAGLAGDVTLDLADPFRGHGEIAVRPFLLESDGHRLEDAGEPLRLTLADGKLSVADVRLSADGKPLALGGAVDLDPSWRPGAESSPVQNVDLHADGTIDASLANDYLAGGAADGPVEIHADLAGSPAELRGHLVLDGKEARILYASPYFTHLADIHADLAFTDGEITFDDVSARLNDGTLKLKGKARRIVVPGGEPSWETKLDATVDGARFVVDYGLATILDGKLQLTVPASGDAFLAGGIEVRSGVLRRDVDIRRELAKTVFDLDTDITGAGSDAVSDMQLDLVVTTAEGIRVRNNLGDLGAHWSELRVGGRLGEPIIEGTIDLAPGGTLRAYGQILRVDRGELVFTGVPGAPPEMELETVSSIEDPSIRQGERLSYEWESTVQSAGAGREIATGLADYAAGLFSERLGGTRISIEPLLIFGETNPGTNLTVSQDLSSAVAVAFAVNLRNSQDQTYLIEAHRRRQPHLAVQVFTNVVEVTQAGDLGPRPEDNEGATLQQTFYFGGDEARSEDPRLRRVRLTGVPEEVSERALRRAVPFSKGDPVPSGSGFEIEVELGERLRRQGYPSAEVRVDLKQDGKDRVDVEAAITAGPRVVFQFEGTAIPSALRKAVTQPYRVDFYEEASREEMRGLAERALRSQGYLRPVVEVTSAVGADGTRTVTIQADGGEKVKLDEVVFTGLDAEEASVLAGRFASGTARVELAAELPEADAWLLSNLRSLGYPEGRVVSRQVDGGRLQVEIDPGPRETLEAVAIRGLAEAEVEELLPRLPLKAGDALRSDLVAASELLIRRDLRHRGYADVEVRTLVAPSLNPYEATLFFEVDPGPQYRLEAVRVAGLRSTRPGWATKLTGLKEGDILDPERISEARRTLSRTRLFTSVSTETEKEEKDGEADLTFKLREAARFSFAYGLRWESSRGTSAIVDAVDHNFLGHGTTLGVRSLYSTDDQAARLYVKRRHLLGKRIGLEFFLEGRQEDSIFQQEVPEFGIPQLKAFVDTVETTLQVSFPWKKWTSRVHGTYKKTHLRREDDPFDPFDELFDITIQYPILGWQLVYDTRDDPVSPEKGLFISTALSATGDYLGSDFDFVRLFSQVTHVRPFGRLSWAHSYRLGLFESKDQNPLSDELFVAGGEYSVRGYGFETLFDRKTGAPGQALLVINQELRFPVWGILRGVFFVDAGGVWENKSDFGSDLYSGVGVGLRARTPVGLVRFDLGRPLDRLEGDPKWRTYLGFGHSF